MLINISFFFFYPEFFSISVFIFVGYLVRKQSASSKAKSAENKAEKIITEAKTKQSELLLKAQDKALKIIEEAKREEEKREEETGEKLSSQKEDESCSMHDFSDEEGDDLYNQLEELGEVISDEWEIFLGKNSDWLIDLGPEGGDEGGRIVTVGTPSNVSKSPGSYTGKYLNKLLQK